MPNRKKVAIIMGSDSDWPVVKSACGVLKDFDVPFEAPILSTVRRKPPLPLPNLPAPMVMVLSCALPVWRPTWQVPLPPTPLCRWSASQ